MTAPIAISNPDFLRLKDYLIAATGLAYYADKDADLAARVGRSMERAGIKDYASYLEALERGDPDGVELDALVGELTIGETYFFRQREQFEVLAGVVLPDILERNRAGRRLRIWSAGCATGAEPYSVALLLQREFGGRLAGWDAGILATDINRDFLERARDARFDEWALRDTPEELRRAFFRRDKTGWVLAPEHRVCVRFQSHNLVRDPFPPPGHGAFDLILCRNVLIYFSREVARGILNRFHECLAEGGWLLVGHAEPTSQLFEAFRTVMTAGETLYQKATLERTTAQACRACADIDSGAPTRPEQISKPVPAPPAAPAVPTDVAQVRVLADSAQWERAAHCCRRLLEQDGLNPAAHFYFALVQEHMGHSARAEESLRRAVYLDRNFVLAHYHLGLLMQRQDARRARRSFQNALELLARMDAAYVFPEGDGITAAELGALAREQLRALDAGRPPQEGGA